MITGITLNLKENSQNVAVNTTNVTISAVITWGGGSYDAYGKPLTLLLDGVQVDAVTAPFNTAGSYSGSEVFYTYQGDVAHAYNGEKTLKCKLVYETTLLGGTRTAEASFTLTPIPRASLVAATDANIGAVSNVTVTRRSAAYSHSVAVSFGDLSGWLDADGGITDTEQKFTATTVPFALPESFYDQIPNDPTGICKLTCRTYSGSTQIGDAQTGRFTVTASRALCVPQVTGRVEDINKATLVLTGDRGKLVRYMSTALCTMTAEAKNGASLQSKSIGGVAVTGDSRTMEAVEVDSVVFSATDSRGYTGSHTVTAELIPYIPLTVNLTARRTDPTSGNGVLSLKGSFYNGSFGAAENSLTVTYRVGDQTGTVDASLAEGSYTAQAQLSGLDYQASHTIEVTVSDALQTLTRTVTVGKGIPVFDWGEEDFAFHVPVAVPEATADDHVVNRGYVAGVLSGHSHAAGDLTSGTLASARLPTVPISKGGTAAATAAGARVNLGVPGLEIQSGTVASGASRTFTFANGVQAVCVSMVNGDYCTSGFWTSGSSGKTDRLYGSMGSGIDFWNTKVVISGKNVTVTRDGATDVTYILTAFTQ